MKKTKKFLALACAILIAASTFSACSFAAAVDYGQPAPQEVSVRAEQTIWYYRVNNGVVQKRLWSITYQRWLTDWMDA